MKSILAAALGVALSGAAQAAPHPFDVHDLVMMERVSDPQDPQQLLLIPRQDLSNLRRVQKGMHSARMRQTWLSSRQETLILNMHRELDRYLLG